MRDVQVSSVLVVNYPSMKKVGIVRGSIARGVIVWEAIVRWAIVQGGIVLGGNYLGGNCPRGNCPVPLLTKVRNELKRPKAI